MKEDQVTKEDPKVFTSGTFETFLLQVLDTAKEASSCQAALKAYEQYRDEEAVKQFYSALAAFQAGCPTIRKTHEARSESGLMYKYAPMEAIVEQVKELLAALRFSYTFDVEVLTDGRLQTTCTLRHAQGYKSSASFATRLIRQTRAMSDAQQDSGTVTLGMRRSFCLVLGITTADEDLDGGKLHEQTLSGEQVIRLRHVMRTAKVTEEALLKQAKVTTLEEIHPDRYDAVLLWLTRRIEQLSKTTTEIPA